ncbi:hypothetical protein E2C01_073467 [Portunus trituberculatus]|uniref:Uncharacterized protein n=1 Tax=Portunus trituberculatus TaxID=210409 RepID=A0A5B7IDL7_PORTR|nr:hypothetical protein [Portunus trituberculatus]
METFKVRQRSRIGNTSAKGAVGEQVCALKDRFEGRVTHRGTTTTLTTTTTTCWHADEENEQ